MTRLFEQAIAAVATLPDAQQDAYALVLLQLVGVDQPPIQLTPEEDADLAAAESEVARGELASEEEIVALWAKYRA
jgi:predicted transcriptional regulator